MELDGVILLAANTARSRAYAQTLQARDHSLAGTILFDRAGADNPGKSGAPPKPGVETSVNLPDLSIPIETTCHAICAHLDSVEAETVNDPAVIRSVKAAADSGAKLVIYSGYGGQLVGPELLSMGLPFLHLHSGWLPEYRGSTTIYYSLLDGESCGVSAILLDPEIDQGPIVGRRKYPPPPASVDIDFFYDSAIRADLMADTVEAWARADGFADLVVQPESSDGAFFVIHPLLKHVALLSLRDEKTL